MIPLSEARSLSLASVEPAPATEVPLLDALGRFLAEAIVSDRDLPGCDNSAMDGLAVRVADTRGATRDHPVRLQLVGTSSAGARVPERPLEAGEAYRIFTGGPVPPGADAVIRQEAARLEPALADVFVEASPGAHIRRRGEELAKGARVFAPGQRVDPHVLGVLASLGRATAPVRPRPRVAILTIGDELVAPGVPSEPYQVYDSNGPLLAALAIDAGAQVVRCERARDDDGELRHVIERILGEVDLLVTSGGASVGGRDRSKPILRELGATLRFDGVALKPGKPAALAVLSGIPIAVLPGNPGAAAVTFDQLVRPMLLKRQGVLEERPVRRVRLDAARSKQAGLTYLLSGRYEARGAESWAVIRPQGAGQILQNVGAQGFVILSRGQAQFERGDEVEMELFHGASYRPVEPS